MSSPAASFLFTLAWGVCFCLGFRILWHQAVHDFGDNVPTIVGILVFFGGLFGFIIVPIFYIGKLSVIFGKLVLGGKK